MNFEFIKDLSIHHRRSRDLCNERDHYNLKITNSMLEQSSYLSGDLSLKKSYGVNKKIYMFSME